MYKQYAHPFNKIFFLFALLTATSPVSAETTPPGPANNAKTLSWTGCGITKYAFMEELAKAYEKKTKIKIQFDKGKSGLDGSISGIQSVNSGEVQIGASCRANIESMAEERNVYQVPVAWDALVFIVHPSNPVDNITFQQAKDIYLGKIKNWNELGGKNQPIELYVRRGKLTGVGRVLRELLFANYDQEFTGAKHIMASSGPLEQGVEQEPNSIAASGVSSSQRRAKEGKVKILKLNGKEASYENIKSGQYVMYRPLYLVSGGVNADPQVKEFISFALSREGQQIIRQTGSVPYSEAIGLVMKQVEQYDRAMERGLYNTQTKK
ncbi:MAG: phosphate ABC transporter substrate-binding protein [Gammaproteobacteria bacterium]|nr:phosphate ABC transporter substrate-binding protein [Gammaproteobacteria bacterium]